MILPPSGCFVQYLYVFADIKEAFHPTKTQINHQFLPNKQDLLNYK